MRTPEKRAALWTAASSAAAGFALVSGVRAATGIGAVALGLSATFTVAATGGAAILAGAALAHYHRNKMAQQAGKAPISFFSRETGKTIAKGLATTTALGVVAATGISGAFLAVAGVALITSAGALYDLNKAIRKGEVKTTQDGFTALGKNLRRRSFWGLMGAGAAVLVGEALQHVTVAPAQHAAASAVPAPAQTASGVVPPTADPLPEVTANLKTLADIEQQLAHPGSHAASQPAAAASAVNVAATAHPAASAAVAAPVHHTPAPVAVATPAPAAPVHHAAAAHPSPAPVIQTMPADLPVVKLSPQEPLAPLTPVDELKLATIPAIDPAPAAEAAPVAEMAEMPEQPADQVAAKALPVAATPVAEQAPPAPAAEMPTETVSPVAAPAPVAAATPAGPAPAEMAPAAPAPAEAPPPVREAPPMPVGERAGRCEIRENFSAFANNNYGNDWPPPPNTTGEVVSEFNVKCTYDKPLMNAGDYVELYVKADNGQGVKEYDMRSTIMFGSRMTEPFAQNWAVPDALKQAGQVMYPGRTFTPVVN